MTSVSSGVCRLSVFGVSKFQQLQELLIYQYGVAIFITYKNIPHPHISYFYYSNNATLSSS